MIRTTALAIGSFATGFTVACWIGWQASPKIVDEQGILREPFALIPLGSLAAVGAVSSFAVYAAIALRRR